MSDRRVQVIVSGNCLSAYIAVCALLQYKLSVVWFKSGEDFDLKDSTFDSISPEGVSFLKNILSGEELEKMYLGFFSGIRRNGQFEPFDTLLGAGKQLKIKCLKEILKKQIPNEGLVFEEDLDSVSYLESHVRVASISGRVVEGSWLLNAEGEKSKLSVQAAVYLSDDLWVKRFLCEPCPEKSNTVEFSYSEAQWRWLAYDEIGQCSVTQWDYKPVSDHYYFNCRWYCRDFYFEPVNTSYPRMILLVPTVFRFDPSSGSGVTLQIKSGLLVARQLAAIEIDGLPASKALSRYSYEMETSFSEVYDALSDFYDCYGF